MKKEDLNPLFYINKIVIIPKITQYIEKYINFPFS